MQRSKPNILITGTPGTGKTTTCQQVVEAIGFTYVNIGDWVKEQELHSGWDDEHDCYIIDEDKVRTTSFVHAWLLGYDLNIVALCPVSLHKNHTVLGVRRS